MVLAISLENIRNRKNEVLRRMGNEEELLVKIQVCQMRFVGYNDKGKDK